MTNKWIVLGNLVAFLRRDIDSQDFSKQGIEVLTEIFGVVGGSAIPTADVEHAVGAKADPATVVVAEGLIVFQKDFLAVGIGGDLVLGDEARDHSAVLLVVVVDVVATAILEVGGEGQAQQALFIALASDPILDVEEGLGGELARFKIHQLNGSGLFHDPEGAL